MLVYLCGSLNEAQVNDSGPCNGGVGDSLSECRSGELIGGWAVGGGVSNAALLKFLTVKVAVKFIFLCSLYFWTPCCVLRIKNIFGEFLM